MAETLDRPVLLAGSEDPIDRRIFYPFLLVGGLCIVWGLRQLVERKVPLLPFGEWFVGAAILHDAVLAPAVIVTGWLLGRGVPRRARAPLTAGLVVAGAILLYSVPALLGDGAEAADPSKLPNDESRNVVLVLLAVVVVTALIVVVRRAPPLRAAVTPVAHPLGPASLPSRVRRTGRADRGPRSLLLVVFALAIAAAADALGRRRRS